MKATQLFELIVRYAKDELEHDQTHPNIGMGMSVKTAVETACRSVFEEAERWERTIAISEPLKKAVVKYLSATGGKLPYVETFDGWKKHDRYVSKGQKAIAYDSADRALFGYWQVTTRTPARRYSYDWDVDFTQPSYYDEPKPKHESDTVYYADGSGYLKCGGPCGNLYFDRNGDT